LPTVDEFSSIYGGGGLDDLHAILAGKPKGGLLLTGNHHWSSSIGQDDRRRSNGYAWYFDFSHGKRDWDPYGYNGSKRALYVRTVDGPAYKFQGYK
jgi:hypothetical protein